MSLRIATRISSNTLESSTIRLAVFAIGRQHISCNLQGLDNRKFVPRVLHGYIGETRLTMPTTGHARDQHDNYNWFVSTKEKVSTCSL